MINRLVELRERQARVVNGILREGVRPRSQLAGNNDLVLSGTPLEADEELPNYVEAVVLFRTGFFLTKREQDRIIRESLCSKETPGFSLFPIAVEREPDYLPWALPKRLIPSKRIVHQARAEASCLIVAGLENSDLGDYEEYGDINVVEVPGGIAPERIGAVIFPESTLAGIKDMLVNPHGVSILSTPLRRQRFLYGMLKMPDYRTALKQAINEVVGSSLVHIVRLPTLGDVEAERLAYINP